MTPELRELTARIQRLENDLLRRPVILPCPTGTQFVRLKITGGNTLLTFGGNDYKGIKEVTSGSLASLPAASPNNTSTYPDGIGYGKLVDQNLVEIPTKPAVWVTNYATIIPDSWPTLTATFGYHVPNGYPCLCKPYVIGGITVYKVFR
jgi:hypothetical protein